MGALKGRPTRSQLLTTRYWFVSVLVAGLLGGQQAPRSGAADALLLAWLGLRMWLGVRSGAPTNSLDPTWVPEPKVKAPRVRKPQHTPPAAAPASQG